MTYKAGQVKHNIRIEKDIFTIAKMKIVMALLCLTLPFPSSTFLRAQGLKYLGLDNELITTLAVDLSDPNIVFAGSSSDFSSGKVGGIFKSINNGLTWDTLFRGGSVREILLHPTGSNIVYASLGINSLTSAGVMKSLDGGKTWAKADSGIYSDFEVGPGQLEIDPQHPDTLYVGTSGVFGGKFYKTINGGQYWISFGDTTNLKYGPTAIAVNPESTQVIYTGTNKAGYIMKSSAGGTTWMFTGLANGVTQSIEFGFPTSTIYFGSWGAECPRGIFKSIDAGASWKNIDEGLPNFIFDVRSMQIYRDSLLERVFMVGNAMDQEYNPIGTEIYIRDNNRPWKLLAETHNLNVYKLLLCRGNLLVGGKGVYRLDNVTSVKIDKPFFPTLLRLFPNYPNPFNASTKNIFEIPNTSDVSLEIYDILGRKIRTLFVGERYSGIHTAEWNGTDENGKVVSSGVYLAVLRTNNAVSIRRMTYLK